MDPRRLEIAINEEILRGQLDAAVEGLYKAKADWRKLLTQFEEAEKAFDDEGGAQKLPTAVLAAGAISHAYAFLDEVRSSLEAKNIEAASSALMVAYRCMITALSGHLGVQLDEPSRRARVAAYEKNKENRECRAQITAWYKEHHREFRSMPAAAEAAFKSKLVPMTRDTLFKWIRAARKELRAEGKS